MRRSRGTPSCGRGESGTKNLILCDALVSHYTFFTQRRWFDDGVILKQYADLAEEML